MNLMRGWDSDTASEEDEISRKAPENTPKMHQFDLDLQIPDQVIDRCDYYP